MQASTHGAPIHFGLMVPINNTTMQPELLQWLPAGSQCTLHKIPRGKGLLTRETIPAYKQQALELAQAFVGAPIDILAYGCTAASFLSGPQADAELADALAQTIGKSVVTTAQSMVLALQAQGLSRIALVTPYQDEVNDQLKSYLNQSGIDVAAFDSLRAPNVDALGLITAEQVAAMARTVMTDAAQAMFIACSQLPTRTILEPLSVEFGRPVLSSIQATAWRIQHTLSSPLAT
jgi:arylmalonate decarboxylase